MNNGFLIVLTLIAHLLGDYYLQFDEIAERKKDKYLWVIIHSVQYSVPFIIIQLLTNIPWINILYITTSHWVVDTVKWTLTRLSSKKRRLSRDSRWIYLFDQLAHVVIIVAIANVSPVVKDVQLSFIVAEDVWLWLLVGLLILRPANISFDIFFGKFKEASIAEKNNLDDEFNKGAKMQGEGDRGKASQLNESSSLLIDTEVEGAGAVIGAIERIITVLFVFLGQFSALGLLMAAKSMARYDKISKSPVFAEYYLIGTLFSILFALLSYLLVFKVIFPQ